MSNRKSSKNRRTLSSREIKRRKRRRIVFGVEAAVLVAAIVALVVYTKVERVDWQQLDEESLEASVNELDEETQEIMAGYTTVALFGVDNRSKGNTESGNTDCIIICSINNDTGEVRLVSVYRDTVMDVNGSNKLKKANYAYNAGGPQQAIEMLNRNLDLNIQYYATVDFYALAEAIDELGGIELEITSAEAEYMNGEAGYIQDTALYTKKTTSDVYVGTQLVDGTQAVAYCRIRYTSGGDFARAQRQRTVLSQMVAVAKTASASQLNAVVNEVFDDVSTNFTLKAILALVKDIDNYELTEMTGFPFEMVVNDSTSLGSIVVPCDLATNVSELHAYLYDNEDYTVSTQVQSISSYIINYTGVTASDALNYGY